MQILYYYFLIGFIVTISVFATKYVLSSSFDQLTIIEIRDRVLGWILLWPILIFYSIPKNGLNSLFEKHQSFDFKNAMNTREDSLFSIWNNLPICSKTLKTQGYDESKRAKLDSTLIFESSVIEEYLINLAPRNEFSVLNQDAILLKWIKNRDKNLSTVCKAPDELDRFNNTANNLLSKKKGSVLCHSCAQKYSAKDLVINKDNLTAGWNFQRILCPNQHLISTVKFIHINCRQR